MMPRSGADYRSYGGPHITEFGVKDASSGDVHDRGLATWADWDQHDRLIVARDGKLLCWRPPDSFDELADFNPQTPESHPTPDWATTWPPIPR